MTNYNPDSPAVYGAAFWKRTGIIVLFAAGAAFFSTLAGAGIGWWSVATIQAAGLAAGAATFTTIAALIGGRVGAPGSPLPFGD